MVKAATRHNTLWPLPGGAGSYTVTLKAILRLATDNDDLDVLLTAFQQQFNVQSRKAARSYVNVATTLGLAEIEGPRVYITEVGSEALTGDTRAVLATALQDRVAGCREILALLGARPHRIGKLRKLLEDDGYTWKTDHQIRHRLRWLEEAGLVKRSASSVPIYGLVGADF